MEQQGYAVSAKKFGFESDLRQREKKLDKYSVRNIQQLYFVQKNRNSHIVEACFDHKKN